MFVRARTDSNMQMTDETPNLRQLAGRLRASHFRTYLEARGWEEKPSRYADHIYFEMAPGGSDDTYELYLPASVDVPKHNTRLMRAIYKLCGIEDREPEQIVRAMFASAAVIAPAPIPSRTICLRVRNSGPTTLQLRIDSPPREHMMLSGEAIELNCQVTDSGSMEIARDETSLTIFTSSRK